MSQKTTPTMFCHVLPQVFEFLTDDNERLAWDVALAATIIQHTEPRIIYSVTHDNIKQMVEERVTLDVDKDYAMTTDLNMPVIVVPSPAKDPKHRGTQVMIDGCHRMYKAYVTGQEMLMVLLTEEEERICRISLEKLDFLLKLKEQINGNH